MTELLVLYGSKHIPDPEADCIIVYANSGNRRPWQARAYRQGRDLGASGFATTAAKAIEAAKRLFAEVA